MFLEKEFGVLDNLDLDISVKTSSELERIAENIVVIIYNDESINIGNDNKITESTIASKIRKKIGSLKNSVGTTK